MGTDPTALDGIRDSEQNTATRRLCAGVYLNRHFRDLVIHLVHNDCRHRVAPSYGFDLVPVLEHARRAWALGTVHQVCAVTVFTIGLLTNFTATVVAGCAITAMPLLVDLPRTLFRVLRLKGHAVSQRWLGRKLSTEAEEELREQVHRLLLDLGGCALIAAGAVFTANQTHTSLRTALPYSGRLLLVTAVLAVALGVTRQLAVNQLHQAANLRPARLSKRSDVVDTQQSSTLVVYSHRYSSRGTPSPFMGSGIVHRWEPWSIQLLRDEKRNAEFLAGDEPRFDTAELMRYLRKKVTELGRSQEGPGVPGLHVRDRLFIAEEKVAAARHLLLAEPTPGEIEEITNDPNSLVQHYLEVCVSRTGEVVTTLFIGLTLRARTLNVDVALGKLTSLPYEFLSVDAHRETGAGAVFRSAFRALRDLPLELGDTWRLSTAPWVAGRALYAQRDRTLVPKRGKVIGPRFSIRQTVEVFDRSRHSAFDQREILENKNVVLNTLLDSIIEFLKSKGMDVSAAERQKSTIINANVFSTGELKIKDSAIGSNAHLSKGSSQDPTSPPGADE